MLAQLVSGPLPAYSPDFHTPPPVNSPTVLAPSRGTGYAGPSPFVQPQPEEPAAGRSRSGRLSGNSARLFVGAGILVCLLVACLGYFVGAPLLQEWLADPTATARPATTAPASATPRGTTPTRAATGSAGDEFQVTIANASPDEVCYVQISLSDSDQWGEDWLAENETIAPGARRVFDVPEGRYDVLVQRCDASTMSTAWGVSGDTTVSVGSEGAIVRLLVENQSSVEICYLHISLSTADDWGQDWLGDIESLQAGNTRIFYLTPGTYDLQVADCDNNTMSEEYTVELTEDTTWTLED